MWKRARWTVTAVLLCSLALALCGDESAEQAEPNRAERPRPPRTHQGARWRQPPSDLTTVQEAELLEMLRQNMPDRHKRLAKLRQERSDAYRRILRWTWLWYVENWKGKPPEVQKAAVLVQVERVRSFRILRELRKTQDAARAEQLRRELFESVSRQHGAEYEIAQYRLQEQKERIRRLEQKLEEDAQQRDEIIGRRVERLLSGRRPGGKHRGPASRPSGRRPGSQPARPNVSGAL